MADLPQKYKAIIYDAPGKVSTKVVELDMPEPGPGEILVNISHSGVCHSDLGVMVRCVLIEITASQTARRWRLIEDQYSNNASMIII
jgi:NADPH:quinone reductase-like Zn-dependent oxidoreductase